MTTIKFETENGQQIHLEVEKNESLAAYAETTFKLTNSILKQLAGWQSKDEEYLNHDLGVISHAVTIMGAQIADTHEENKPRIIGSIVDLSCLYESMEELKTQKHILY